MSGRKIENDEQYFKSLDWMVEKAKQMDHPLLDEDGKAKLMQQYNFVEQGVLEYKERQNPKEEKEAPQPDEQEEIPQEDDKSTVNVDDWLG